MLGPWRKDKAEKGLRQNGEAGRWVEGAPRAEEDRRCRILRTGQGLAACLWGALYLFLGISLAFPPLGGRGWLGPALGILTGPLLGAF